MAEDILQRFLTKRLFDVGGDDARVAPLRDAADDVVTLIKAAPQRAPVFTMVAIDGAIGPDEPLVGEVMSILEKRWQSYAGAFADSKLPTVARAIILHALSKAMGSDPIAAAVSLTARTMLPHLGVLADKELWTDVIDDAERRLALRAEREWALPSAAKAAEIELSFAGLPQLAVPTTNRDWLARRLGAAVGPKNSEGAAIESANPHFPDEGEPWAFQFAPIAATAIANAVNAVAKAVVERVDEREGGEALREAIGNYVKATAEALTRTAMGLERRSALLWWKEALYSPAAQTSYRDLDPSVGAALAAVDASAQTGPFAPRMAEAMVRETLLSIDKDSMGARKTLVNHCKAIATAAEGVRGAIQARYAGVHSEAGRSPLAGLISAEVLSAPEVVERRLGLPGNLEISAIDLGVWLFRDLQASAATPVPVKRGRKG
jgi:DNA-binding transcriptional ArsR family regulator